MFVVGAKVPIQSWSSAEVGHHSVDDRRKQVITFLFFVGEKSS